LIRWGTIIVLAGIFGFVVCTLIAIGFYGPFNMSTQYLSELGVRGKSAPFFNAGCILCGLSMVPFFMTLGEEFAHTRKMDRVVILGLVACLSLVGIGTFTIQALPIHALFDLLFFSTINMVIFQTSTILLERQKYWLASLGYFFIILNIYILSRYSLAASQKVCVLSILAWIVIVTLGMRYKAFKKDLDNEREFRKLLRKIENRTF
jgi:hypothetical membrane protein